MRVHYVSGLIRVNNDYRSWRRSVAERRRREQAEIDTRRRVLDLRTFLLLVDDVWFCVEVDGLPKGRCVETVIDGKLHRRVLAEGRYDVIQRREISLATSDELRQCKYRYGS